jgi:hypothetical protein
MQSLHVPASTIQRIVRIGRWLVPSSGAVLAGIMTTYQWLGSRASTKFVSDSVSAATLAAKAAQSDALHAASITDLHSHEIAALWDHIVAMRAELKVHREYGKQDAQTKSRYIEQAQQFYALRFEEQLRTHATNPAEAARLALLQQWRPDR